MTVVLGLWVGLGAFASAQTPNLSFTVPRVSQAPKVDGALNDATWLQASQKGGKTVVDLNHTGNALTQYPRVAYLGYDDNALYVAFVIYAPNPKALVTGNPGASNNDEVEIFLSAVPGGYNQILVTADGTMDQNVRGSAAPVEVSHAVAVGDISWIVEVAIPFKSIGRTPKAGDKWTLNLNGRQIAAGDMWLAWNPTYGGFHNEARFGTIIFGE